MSSPERLPLGLNYVDTHCSGVSMTLNPPCWLKSNYDVQSQGKGQGTAGTMKGTVGAGCVLPYGSVLSVGPLLSPVLSHGILPVRPHLAPL